MKPFPLSFFGKNKSLLDNAVNFIASARRPRREENSEISHGALQTWLLPPHALTYTDMISLSDMQVNTRTCKKHIKWEVFRRGLEWIPLWSAYCKKCDVKYKEISPHLPCPECGEEMEGPDYKQYRKAQEFFETVNMNNQSLQQVLEQLEDDQNACDEGYMVIRKNYLYNKQGEIIAGSVREILRGSPTIMRPVANPKTGVLGWSIFICPEHRTEPYTFTDDNFDISDLKTPMRCRHTGCNKMMYPVHYVACRMEGGDPESYYIDGEVINGHKYGAGMLFGTPPMLTLWTITSALFYQETYIRDYYQERRTPLGAIVVNTSNAPGFLRFWKKVNEELDKDKLFIPFVPLETEPGNTGSGRINWVSFMDKLTEMEYVPSRDEFRRAISAFYGVSTMFMNEQITAGQGSLSEGIHLVVSLKTVERTQNLYNQVYLPKVCQMLGVTDWVLQLKPTEERNELKRLQQEQLQMQLNQLYLTIGYESEQDPYTGEWYHHKDISKELTKAMNVMNMLISIAHPELNAMGQMGGNGGGGQPPGGGPPQGSKHMTTYNPNEGATNKGDEIITKYNPHIPGHSFTACVGEMMGKGHSEESAKKICGALQARSGEVSKGEIEKTQQEGTPHQGTTSISSPSSIKNPESSQALPSPESPANRTKNAPGTPKAYVCPICGRSFDSKEQLGGHMKGEHPGNDAGAGALEPGMASMVPTTGMYLRAIKMMRQSLMFDKNVLNLLESCALGGALPELEEANAGEPKRARRSEPQGYRKPSVRRVS